ncbi:MAG: hypothetical protein QGH23_05975 [Dehalococcoidia bacterium]|jgi:hypothetical protein|nr:hypothetical protein [Dehalococcoidia bacterium]MDP6510740.1 hypothetical protein [Dehalococcoidia bacterium]MDP6782539.1 hypothetical protein [Dehalococcoidia bacterium]|tara:strand:- start:101 stop:346 length:246 start_codon:yes stop_codon:yes gene_type:complete
MQSSLIGKIEKARRYAGEPDRISFSSFTIRFRGENNQHRVSFNEGQWQCSCSFFSDREVCSHTMAMERVLAGMLLALPTLR